MFIYRKVQEALEKHNQENFKKRDAEKRKVDEATEKAKELMRVNVNKNCHLHGYCLKCQPLFLKNSILVKFPPAEHQKVHF